MNGSKANFKNIFLTERITYFHLTVNKKKLKKEAFHFRCTSFIIIFHAILWYRGSARCSTAGTERGRALQACWQQGSYPSCLSSTQKMLSFIVPDSLVYFLMHLLLHCISICLACWHHGAVSSKCCYCNLACFQAKMLFPHTELYLKEVKWTHTFSKHKVQHPSSECIITENSVFSV